MNTFQQTTAVNTLDRGLFPSCTGKTLLALLLLFFGLWATAQTVNKEYHHWANGGTVSTTPEWRNGALQKTNSSWAEGDVVPHVYTPDTKGWTANSPHTIVIHYDYSQTTGGVTTGGFVTFVNNFLSPAMGYFPLSTPVQTGTGITEFYTDNIVVNNVIELSDVGSGNQVIKRVQLDFTYTGPTNTGNATSPAALYFGLRLATAGEVASPSNGASNWPGASLQTSLNGSGARTLSINLSDQPVVCGNITATIEGTTTVCEGDPEPLITFSASGGNPPYTFTYTDPNGNTQTISTNGSDNSVTLAVPTNTTGAQTYTLTHVEGQFCDNNANGSVTITVNPLPNAQFSGSTTCASSSVIYTAASGLNSYAWYVDNILQEASTGNTLVVQNGPAGSSYTVKLVVTKDGCTNESSQTITSVACDQRTLTQGFYGNTNGKACGDNKNALAILGEWLYGGRIIGRTNAPAPVSYYASGKGKLTLASTDATALNNAMPGGTTPNRINSNSTILKDLTIATIEKRSGKIINVLITQTITLGVNLFRNNNLGSVVLEPNKWATVLRNTSVKCNTPVVGSCGNLGILLESKKPTMSTAAATYLNGKTINELYSLANDVLGGVVLPAGVSYSDINNAVNFMNNLFDGSVLYLGNFTSPQTTCPSSTSFTTSISKPIVEMALAKTLIVAAYPNPFTDKIRFTLQSPTTGRATLEVYNMLGQKVSVPFEGNLQSGELRNVEYTAPASHRSSLIYRFTMNGEQVSGKLMSTRQ